jgi:hypothetical protein
MKSYISFVLLALLTACCEKKIEKKKGNLYYLTNYFADTIPYDSVFIDTSKLVILSTKNIGDRGSNICVKKMTNPHAGIDAEEHIYFTPDFGAIYMKNIAWRTFWRLHSTNDSVERKISNYIDHILLNTEMVIEGDVPIKYKDPSIELSYD